MPASPQQYLMENMIKQKRVGTKNGTWFWYNVTMDMNTKTTVGPGVEVEPGALCLSVRVSLPDPTQTNHFLTTFISRLVMTGFFVPHRKERFMQWASKNLSCSHNSSIPGGVFCRFRSAVWMWRRLYSKGQQYHHLWTWTMDCRANMQ